VGHSLGGSVALELQKQHPNLTSRTFGAPVWDPFGEDNKYTRSSRSSNFSFDKGFGPLDSGPQDSLGRGRRGQVDRYRNVFDPVSMFDGSAKNSIKGNPFDSKSLTHDYSNIANKFQAGGADHAYGWQNPDGTTSLTE
jgi:pimeloyl-ACP methyl ester carboxylesterase